MQRVKIVATLGPASSTAQVVGDMINKGLDAARLNFSHGDYETHRQTFQLVRAEASRQNAHVAILADLSGPKIRIGRLTGGAVELQAGAPVTITTEPVTGDEHCFSTNYSDLPSDVRPGSPILLDDGLLELRVEKVVRAEVHCVVVAGGVLKERKGMNLPNTPLSTPALTDKDKQDLLFAKELGVDYFALSFVRSAADVQEAKDLAGDIPVIAKIEKPEALSNIDAILQVADGLMVARGDLGVEAGAEKVPLIQKKLIQAAGARGLPVIVATQMLESMTNHRTPTRAEVSDVANAVLDGTDAVMLSGETAVGEYPVETVAKMAKILGEVEQSDYFRNLPKPARSGEQSFSYAVAGAAVTAAADLNLKALAVYTETGHSASLVSACRPQPPIVAFSRHGRVLQKLALRWGIIPIYARWEDNPEELVALAGDKLFQHHLAGPGDDIAITYGMEDISNPGTTDTLKLCRIRG